MSRVSAIFRLQTLDVELSAHHAKVKLIDDALADSPALREAHQVFLDAQTQAHTTQVSVKSLEDSIQILSEKMAEASDRLYSGLVTNPKELQDLQKEIDSLKRRRGTLEEEQLEALIQNESAETRLNIADMEVKRIEAEVAKLRSDLVEERQALKMRIERLDTEREATEISVPLADREVYERLRRAKNGRAVAKLEDGVCTACGVAPSNARIRDARQGSDLVRCSNCERILYVE